ncbi:hypothetical protein [Halomonas mongoliensis]|uniref:hypothetical protein n=1 Tax=Halomonas mongoliensis TaxID=321265 RepID=UPI00403B15FB
MNARLEGIVDTLRCGVSAEQEADLVGVLSTGERCYVALAARRADLLPEAYWHPVEAWHRLDADWQRAVCRHNDWPESWVSTTRLEIAVNLHRLRIALDAAGVPASTLQGAEGIAERLQYLVEERDGLQLQLESRMPGGDAPARSARHR